MKTQLMLLYYIYTFFYSCAVHVYIRSIDISYKILISINATASMENCIKLKYEMALIIFSNKMLTVNPDGFLNPRQN